MGLRVSTSTAIPQSSRSVRSHRSYQPASVHRASVAAPEGPPSSGTTPTASPRAARKRGTTPLSSARPTAQAPIRAAPRPPRLGPLPGPASLLTSAPREDLAVSDDDGLTLSRWSIYPACRTQAPSHGFSNRHSPRPVFAFARRLTVILCRRIGRCHCLPHLRVWGQSAATRPILLACTLGCRRWAILIVIEQG